MMSSDKKKLRIFNTVSVSLGCSSCKKTKLTSFFKPKPKPKPKPPSYNTNSLYNYSSSSSSRKTTQYSSFSEYETANSFSPRTEDMDTDADQDTKRSTAAVRGFGRVGGESLAVEKDSNDPYLDFRHSMLQMILEKEIYSKDDLRELLNCFLQLNSPDYHGIIVRAFTEIWNGVFSVKPGAGAYTKMHRGFRPRDF